jgi:hypothetical protein
MCGHQIGAQTQPKRRPRVVHHPCAPSPTSAARMTSSGPNHPSASMSSRHVRLVRARSVAGLSRARTKPLEDGRDRVRNRVRRSRRRGRPNGCPRSCSRATCLRRSVRGSELGRLPRPRPCALEIRATAEGSFDVHLILHAADAWDKIVQLFSSDAATALLQLKEYILLPGAGVFWLIRRMRGRKAKAQQQLEPGRVRLVLDDETSLEIPAAVWALYQSVEVQKNARRVIEPLTRDGIDAVEFRVENEVAIRLDQTDLPAYDLPEVVDMPLLDQEIEMVVAITSVTFAEGNKWRFTAGDETFHAAVEDPAFLRRVDRGEEAFRKGDMLRCRMRLVQHRRGDSLQTERFVVEVIEHLPRGMQLRLGLDVPPRDTGL